MATVLENWQKTTESIELLCTVYCV